MIAGTLSRKPISPARTRSSVPARCPRRIAQSPLAAPSSARYPPVRISATETAAPNQRKKRLMPLSCVFSSMMNPLTIRFPGIRFSGRDPVCGSEERRQVVRRPVPPAHAPGAPDRLGDIALGLRHGPGDVHPAAQAGCDRRRVGAAGPVGVLRRDPRRAEGPEFTAVVEEIRRIP